MLLSMRFATSSLITGRSNERITSMRMCVASGGLVFMRTPFRRWFTMSPFLSTLFTTLFIIVLLPTPFIPLSTFTRLSRFHTTWRRPLHSDSISICFM